MEVSSSPNCFSPLAGLFSVLSPRCTKKRAHCYQPGVWMSEDSESYFQEKATSGEWTAVA